MLLVLSTCPNMKCAEKIAKALVKKKLTACVSIVKVEKSIYRWKGRICDAKEYLLIIKTIKTRYPKLKTAIENLHPYEVPEIIAINVAKGNRKYVEWVRNCCETRSR